MNDTLARIFESPNASATVAGDAVPAVAEDVGGGGCGGEVTLNGG